MGPYLPGLLQAIKTALTQKKPCPEAFSCMAMLAHFHNSPGAVAEIQAILRTNYMYKYGLNYLAFAFGLGLTQTLVTALKDLKEAIPSLAPVTQSNLLQLIASVLQQALNVKKQVCFLLCYFNDSLGNC